MSIDLTTHVGNVLTLNSPFWVASSHYSENEAVLKQWQDFAPAAITLKTCTKIDRTEQKKLIREKTKAYLPRYGRGYYSDGPKTKELKSYEEAKQLLAAACDILPRSKIGVSVLATDKENYAELADLCKEASFVELNLKYSMRSKTKGASFFDSVRDNWTTTLEQIERFLAAFQGRPVFIKVSRELEWLPNTKEMDALLDKLRGHGQVGLVLANSRKSDIAPFFYEDEEKNLEGGVMSGDGLYDSTISLIHAVSKNCDERGIPIVATGGMVDEQQILMAIRAGASAIQLCTAFDYNGLGFYQTLDAGLRERMKWRGWKEVDEAVKQIRNEAIASVFSMPFRYSASFWADEFQK